MEEIHQQMLEDETPENERMRLNPDHWYELNLTNSTLFANLAPEKVDGMEQLVPGRLFTTRMPRNLNDSKSAANEFIKKCEDRQLRVVFVLTQPDEFVRYAGVDSLLDFYKQECGLITYNGAIPDFKIPTEGDLVNYILDLTYHLASGHNCLVHCAGGSGRTGMVVAAIVQNFGVYDVVSRIRKVKSTYVETAEQELFLKKMPKALSSKLVKKKPLLARAIAAEHLIQVFRTHKEELEQAKSRASKEQAIKRFSSGLRNLGDTLEESLKETYGQIFDLIDYDGNGKIDNEELSKWFEMVGAEIDIKEVKEAFLGDDRTSAHLDFTRDRFTDFMSKKAKHHRREYELGVIPEK